MHLRCIGDAMDARDAKRMQKGCKDAGCHKSVDARLQKGCNWDAIEHVKDARDAQWMHCGCSKNAEGCGDAEEMQMIAASVLWP